MSTKTSFKRIALVAVAALSLGGISAVSAHATTYSSTAAGWSVLTAGTGASTAASGTGLSVAGTQVVGGTATLTYTFPSVTGGAVVEGNFASSGVGSVIAGSVIGSAGTPTISGAMPENSFLVTSGTSTETDTVTITVTSSVAGVQTLTMIPLSSTGTPGTAKTATITWGSAPTVSTQFSTVGINPTLTPVAVTPTAAVLVGTNAVNTPSATIGVSINSAYQTPLAGTGLSAVVTSGPGTLSAIADAGSAFSTMSSSYSGRSVSISAANSVGTAGLYQIELFADGTAGLSTITVSVGTVVVGTVSYTFTGTAKAVKATQNLKVLKAGGTASVGGVGLSGKVYSGTLDAADATTTLTSTTADTGLAPITVFTTDTNGFPVPIDATDATKIKVVSSDKTVLTAGTCVNALGATITAGKIINQINCYVLGSVGAASGSSATATVELYNSTTAAWDILAAPLTFKIGGSVAKEVVTTDASSYSPNQPLVVTVTATDSAGNAAYDQDAALIAYPVSSTYMYGLLTNLPTALIGGVSSSTVGAIFAPAQEGDFTISGLDGASAAGEAVSVTATVGSGAAAAASQAATDAAQEATDAANAAYDAANNAMDSADAATAAAQDASDNASAALAAVTSLSATVAKLVSSVTAIATALAAIKKKLGVK